MDAKSKRLVTAGIKRAKASLASGKRIYRLDLEQMEQAHRAAVRAVASGKAPLLFRRVELANGAQGTAARWYGGNRYSGTGVTLGDFTADQVVRVLD